jgi:hypothetical protein
MILIRKATIPGEERVLSLHINTSPPSKIWVWKIRNLAFWRACRRNVVSWNRHRFSNFVLLSVTWSRYWFAYYFVSGKFPAIYFISQCRNKFWVENERSVLLYWHQKVSFPRNNLSSPPFACPDRVWGPPSLLSNGYRGLFPLGVKRSWREAEHPAPTSAEIKKMWIYTSPPPYAFMA